MYWIVKNNQSPESEFADCGWHNNCLRNQALFKSLPAGNWNNSLDMEAEGQVHF